MPFEGPEDAAVDLSSYSLGAGPELRMLIIKQVSAHDRYFHVTIWRPRQAHIQSKVGRSRGIRQIADVTQDGIELDVVRKIKAGTNGKHAIRIVTFGSSVTETRTARHWMDIFL